MIPIAPPPLKSCCRLRLQAKNNKPIKNTLPTAAKIGHGTRFRSPLTHNQPPNKTNSTRPIAGETSSIPAMLIPTHHQPRERSWFSHSANPQKAMAIKVNKKGSRICAPPVRIDSGYRQKSHAETEASLSSHSRRVAL